MNPIDALMERLRYELAKLGSGWPGEGRQQRIEDFRGMSPPPSISDAIAERAAYEARKAGTGLPGPGQQQRIQDFQRSGMGQASVPPWQGPPTSAMTPPWQGPPTPRPMGGMPSQQVLGRTPEELRRIAEQNAEMDALLAQNEALQQNFARVKPYGDKLIARNARQAAGLGTPPGTFKARIAQAQGALQPGYTRTVGGSPVSSLDAIWALGGRKYPGLTPEELAAKAAREAPGPSIAERLEALATGQGPGLAGINPEAAGKYHNQATVGPHGVKVYRRPDGRIILFGSDYYRDDPERKQFRDTAAQRQSANRQAMRDRMALRRAGAALGRDLGEPLSAQEAAAINAATQATAAIGGGVTLPTAAVSVKPGLSAAQRDAIAQAKQRSVQRRGMSRGERMLADRLEQLSAGAGEGGGGNLFDVIKTYQTGLAMGLSPEGAGKIAQAQYEAGLRANDPAIEQQRLDRESREQLARDEMALRRDEASADRTLKQKQLNLTKKELRAERKKQESYDRREVDQATDDRLGWLAVNGNSRQKRWAQDEIERRAKQGAGAPTTPSPSGTSVPAAATVESAGSRPHASIDAYMKWLENNPKASTAEAAQVAMEVLGPDAAELLRRRKPEELGLLRDRNLGIEEGGTRRSEAWQIAQLLNPTQQLPAMTNYARRAAQAFLPEKYAYPFRKRWSDRPSVAQREANERQLLDEIIRQINAAPTELP